MKGSRVAIVVLVAAVSGAFACADVLGIDDGQPRDDASVPDVTIDQATPQPDASDAAPFDAADAAPPPMSPLSCGSATCNAYVEACCRTGVGTDAAAMSFKCVTDAADCKSNADLLVTCDRPANCEAQGHPGDVCCAWAPVGQPAKSTGCAPDCADATVLCDPGDDELCKAIGLSCGSSITTIVGFDLCK